VTSSKEGHPEVLTSYLYPQSQGCWFPHSCNTCKQADKEFALKPVGWTTSYTQEATLTIMQ